MKNYEYIPNEIYEFMEKVMIKKTTHRLLQGLEKNYDLVMKDIDACFALASTITGLSPSELVKKSDFKINDFDSDRFDSMLAEIRTIVYLNNIGFEEIKPLKAPKGIKEADLLAELNGTKWAIEVLCSSYQSGRWTHKEIVNYIERRFVNDNKIEQLHRTAVKYKCTCKLLVVIMNSSGQVHFCL